MAHRRHTPLTRHQSLRDIQPLSSSPAALVRRRKYPTRNSPNSRRRALGLLHPSRRSVSHTTATVESDGDDDQDEDSSDERTATPTATDNRLRPVLAALHQNLRRLPSRLLLAAQSTATRHKRERNRDSSMRDVEPELAVQIGAKRKRVVSSNENAVATRGSRSKRMKAYTPAVASEEESEMEIDTPTTWTRSDDSESDEDAEDDDSSDEYLLKTASSRQLLRMRKDELIHLYTSAGLSPPSSFESLTKPELVDAIIGSRDEEENDTIELPPSSPRGSEYSSDGDVEAAEAEEEETQEVDDGNIAGGEETDAGTSHSKSNRRGNNGGGNPLRRRATVNDLAKSVGVAMGRRPIGQSRSLSMGQIGGAAPVMTRRRASSRSSPTTSMSHHQPAHLPSPPATRTRSRKTSDDTASTSTLKVNGKGKGKAKQVEFSDNVEVQVTSPSPMEDDDAGMADGSEIESDLTDLAELEEDLEGTPKASSSKSSIAMPSPRRLRSKSSKDVKSVGKGRPLGEVDAEADLEMDRRVTPARKAKGRVGSLREDSESLAEDEDIEIPDAEEVDEDEQVEDEEEEEEETASNDEEVDQLISSPSPTPPPLRGRRTPVKRRLRPRRVQTYTPPSDGDDEEEVEEAEDADVDGSVAASEEDVFEDAAEAPVSTTPRKLRSGRIVGEDEEEDIGEEDEDEEEEEEEEFEDAEAESVDMDAEGETEEESDEPMDDDIDLTIATTKTLVRLRRDDLIRLCETRDLEPVGTKPQLASALLEWRDQQSQSGFSSPSSTGTVRPPSTVRRRRKSSSGRTKSKTPPVLLRSHHFHADEPRTPPLSSPARGAGSGGKDEPELELDLESLGLDDREIPPEKLTKLEKIGSGGFKDVFIGKLKGRRVAISEFRGQLSAMDIKELKLLGGFDHPNIVRFLGVSIPENTRDTPVMIVSELCSNGDLFDYVRNVPPPSLHKVLNIMLDIARGLEYLHLRKPSVIHRDCKSSNILITSRGTAKIADFGLAKVKQSTRSMVRSLVGTVNWQAPELWHAHPKYNHKVDVFSCAMVYWEMLQWHIKEKKFPWEGMNEHAIYEIVGAKRQRPSISGLRKVWSSEVVDLLERMWAHEHQERPTMSEVVQELEQLIHNHSHKK